MKSFRIFQRSCEILFYGLRSHRRLAICWSGWSGDELSVGAEPAPGGQEANARASPSPKPRLCGILEKKQINATQIFHVLILPSDSVVWFASLTWKETPPQRTQLMYSKPKAECIPTGPMRSIQRPGLSVRTVHGYSSTGTQVRRAQKIVTSQSAQ